MKEDQHTCRIELAGPETIVEIKKYPSMKFIFLKALIFSPFRANTIADDARVNKTRMILKNYVPDKKLIMDYRQVCSFSIDRPPDIIPISYLQTRFIGLLGTFITSSYFPINPLGLIHIFQSFEQKRPVTTNETVDLACTLLSINKTEKGMESSFSLEIISGGSVVWQGISTFLSKNHIKRKKNRRSKKIEDIRLEEKETITIAANTGRKYATVSGDYNPHHLHTIPAKLFGFKRAIAHGMWSFARVIASLDKEFCIQESAKVEASFKLPVFMPATTTLGYESRYDEENQSTIVDFELRDKQKGLPHLKGRLLNNI